MNLVYITSGITTFGSGIVQMQSGPNLTAFQNQNFGMSYVGTVARRQQIEPIAERAGRKLVH